MPTNWREKDADTLVNTLTWLETNVLENPKVGTKVKRILKEVVPEYNDPALELEDRLSAKEAELTERVTKFEQAQQQKENKEFWDKEQKAVREEYEFSDEDMEAVKKHMIDNHVGSMRIAARDYANFIKAPAEPTNYQERTGIQLPSMDGLMKDPTRWATDEAFKALGEIQRGNSRGR